MNYSDFISTVTKRAEKTAGKEGHVYVNQIIKNNDTKLDGLVIMEKGHTMAPTIYLNDYYPFRQLVKVYIKKKEYGNVNEVISIYWSNHCWRFLRFGNWKVNFIYKIKKSTK